MRAVLGLLLVVVAPAAALAAPAAAPAPFAGKTAQGLPARVGVYPTGDVHRLLLNWRAHCTSTGHLRAYTSWTYHRSNTSARAVDGAGHYVQRDGAYHERIRAFVRARRASPSRWHGTLRIRATVLRGPRVIDHCRLYTRWSARRR